MAGTAALDGGLPGAAAGEDAACMSPVSLPRRRPPPFSPSHCHSPHTLLIYRLCTCACRRGWARLEVARHSVHMYVHASLEETRRGELPAVLCCWTGRAALLVVSASSRRLFLFLFFFSSRSQGAIVRCTFPLDSRSGEPASYFGRAVHVLRTLLCAFASSMYCRAPREEKYVHPQAALYSTCPPAVPTIRAPVPACIICNTPCSLPGRKAGRQTGRQTGSATRDIVRVYFAGGGR